MLGQSSNPIPHTLGTCGGRGLAAAECSLSLGCGVDEDSWKAVASVMQVNELWAAVEHFNMQQRLGHHITRGRRDDACRMLQQLAVTVCCPSLACCVLCTLYCRSTFGLWGRALIYTFVVVVVHVFPGVYVSLET